LVWSAGPNQFVAELTGHWPPGRALDVACGEGRNALWLAEQGWDVLGVDFSPVAIDKARRAAEQRGADARFEVADVTALPDLGEFDLVVVAYLQLPPAELETVLAALTRLVAPGGRLLVIGHHVDNLDRGYGGPASPEVLHDPRRVAEVIGAADPQLRIDTADEVLRAVQTDDGPQQAVDSLVLASRPTDRSLA
jgi:SAM-dependent methyltransferase